MELANQAKPKTAPDGAPLIPQKTGGALKVGGSHPRKGPEKSLAQRVIELTQNDVLKRVKVMKRIIDAYDRDLQKRVRRGSMEVPTGFKPLVTTGDAIKAFNTLVDLSGLKVTKVAETDAEGNDRREFDERALQAILASRNRLN